jgi:HPt (histidine-containing phosphotransfer) domain-containing protein
MAHAPSVDELMARARAEFAGRLPAKVEELERLSSSGAWQDLRRASHKLRGSAATYGFVALGSLAAAIEDLLLAASCMPDDAARERLGGALADARAEARRASEQAP